MAALLAVVAGTASAAIEPAQFSHCREIASDSEQEEIAAVTLDEASWDLLAVGAPNLCVVDAVNAPAPVLMRRATARRVRRVRATCRSKVAALRELPENRIEVDIDLLSQAPVADTIVFVTPLRDFERSISVDGIGADGTATRLVSDALIYDYTRFMDVRHVTVALPRNEYRKLKISIDAVTDTTQSPRTEITRSLRESEELQRTETTVETTRPFRIGAVQLSTHRDEAHNREPVTAGYKLKGWSVSEDAKKGTTTVEVETFHTPLTSFTIETGVRNFSRRVSVLVPYRRDGREQWRQVGAATLSRISFRSFKKDALKVTFPEQQQRRFRLVFQDGDAVPLKVDNVIGHGPAWQVLFLAAPSDTYRLLLGGSIASKQRFDTSHIERLLAREIAPREFEVGPVIDNPDYDAKASRSLTQWLGSRTFFAVGIVLVVAVLGVGLVRAGKAALAESEGESDS
ncbi:MAG: hypothetical protein QGH42_12575 [Kiritimatiellia bacterium]|nr:hypothetical protein [Kiritimatiellia bacterium]MDP7025060.1 hypothetical protein [Kiritimatiellia bacterium]